MIEPVAKDKCLPELVALFPELVAHRHDIHQHPDCGFETQRTIGKIKEFLEKHNVSPKDMDDTTCPGSLFVEIKGNLPGKTIGFRADIDALKMKDLSGKEWSSQIDGRLTPAATTVTRPGSWVRLHTWLNIEISPVRSSVFSRAPKKSVKEPKASCSPVSSTSTKLRKCTVRTMSPS